MGALSFNILRIAYLVLLWLFVLFAFGVLRRDIVARARDKVGKGKRLRRGEIPPQPMVPAGVAMAGAAIPGGVMVGAAMPGGTMPGPGVLGGVPVAGFGPDPYAVAQAPDPFAPGQSVPGEFSHSPYGAAMPAPSAPTGAYPAPSELVVTAGPLAGTRLPLSGSAITVGRAAGNDLVLADDFASSRHARFVQQGGQWFLEDLNSTNGTLINGNPVTGITPLAPGNSVQIGQAMIELR